MQFINIAIYAVLTLAGLVSVKIPISLCHKKKNEYLGT
jgi:hypothetical protein